MGQHKGWEATFSAPKSESLTALVDGDHRVRQAHEESVRVALKALKEGLESQYSSHFYSQRKTKDKDHA
jgi:conjugative relaxase-like TrwC/TraI family protein